MPTWQQASFPVEGRLRLQPSMQIDMIFVALFASRWRCPVCIMTIIAYHACPDARPNSTRRAVPRYNKCCATDKV